LQAVSEIASTSTIPDYGSTLVQLLKSHLVAVTERAWLAFLLVIILNILVIMIVVTLLPPQVGPLLPDRAGRLPRPLPG
jgi:hypothetical protein